jgi:hypothetical protein
MTKSLRDFVIISPIPAVAGMTKNLEQIFCLCFIPARGFVLFPTYGCSAADFVCKFYVSDAKAITGGTAGCMHDYKVITAVTSRACVSADCHFLGGISGWAAGSAGSHFCCSVTSRTGCPIAG